jgi:hypothetical protein
VKVRHSSWRGVACGGVWRGVACSANVGGWVACRDVSLKDSVRTSLLGVVATIVTLS